MKLGSLFDGSAGFPLAGSKNGINPVWASEVEPYPIAVSKSRFPRMKHLGSITDINGAEIEPVDIITFGSPCFPSGTLVLTSEGYIGIEDVKKDMYVLTHTGQWKRVLQVGSKIAETIILKGNHYGLECTPNHPIYSIYPKRIYPTKDDGLRTSIRSIPDAKEWIEAQNMLGRCWAVPRHIEPLLVDEAVRINQRQKAMPEMDEHFFYFVGRWLGDGWLRDTQRCGRPNGQKSGVIILCDDKANESELIDIVKRISDHYSVERCDTSVKVKFTSQVLCKWLNKNFGKGAKNKHLPSWVYGMHENYRKSLLQGLTDSDGYSLSDKQWRICTTSKALSQGVRLLAETLAYSTTIYKTTPEVKGIIQGREVNQSVYYTVQFMKTHQRHLFDDIHSWYKVKNITKTNTLKRVYNLTVEGDNSYVADGIVVHNCQDLSIAGQRKGLDGGQRSVLFYEAIRVIKEMRSATNGKYPRYIVWENVFGAFSSNKGKDFKQVLQEIVGVVSEANVPEPPSGKWKPAGSILGDGWSVAYRTFDAQYWGVPQRRRRIYLVADFAGERAGEILFEQNGVSRNPEESGETREEIAGYAAGGAGGGCDDRNCLTPWDVQSRRIFATAGTWPALYGGDGGGHGYVCYISDVLPFDTTQITSPQNGCNPQWGDPCHPLAAQGHPPTVICELAAFKPGQGAKARSIGYDGNVAPSLASEAGGNAVPAVVIALQANGIDRADTAGCNGARWRENGMYTLNTIDRHAVAYSLDSLASNSMKSPNPNSGCHETEVSKTIDTSDQNPSKNQGGVVVVFHAQQDPISNDKIAQCVGAQNQATSGVCYTATSFAGYTSSNPTLRASGGDLGGGSEGIVVHPRVVGTLAASGAGTDRPAGQGNETDMVIVTPSTPPRKYIVRRLTPTECARLQGFPDAWADIPNITEDDREFWEDVRKTHAEINGKKYKPVKDIVKWHKALHTDGAEYKMWGNGIALPCAYFVLKGISSEQ